MKIVKRDGRIVEYNADKIKVAIGKANNEVPDDERIADKDIDGIIKYIESLGKKRMLVEDIQDIIEVKLMEKKKYHLAKTYIIYRYKRSVIRQSNTIDASILSILKNGGSGERNYLDANRQRDVMAGEVSKDLAFRLLLPRNVVEASKRGHIEFCNVEYFTEPVIDSAKIDLADMFENGTVINGIKIDEPRGFQSACNILVEIVAGLASTQTGNIYIDYKDLFKYYHLTFEKMYSVYSTLMRDHMTDEQIKAISHTQAFLEVKTGIQTILYQINTITIGSGLVPKVHFLIDMREVTTNEEERLVFEFVKQKANGIENENGKLAVTHYPKIVYMVCDDATLREKYDYITREIIGVENEFSIMSEKRYDAFLKEVDKFNQGSIALNLAKLAIDSTESGQDFFGLLKQSLSICYEGLLCRNHNLQGIYSGKSPLHWQYGAIARLASTERIDQYLKKGSSVMSLIVVGFEAAVHILGDDDYLKKRIRDEIVETVKRWNKESNFETVISNDYKEFTDIDMNVYKKYGLENLQDSSSFMCENYFKDGYIYLYTNSSIDVVNDDVLNENFIIRRIVDIDDE